MSNEEESTFSRYISYKVFPSYALNLQTTTIYYLISSVFTRDKDTAFLNASVITSFIMLVLIAAGLGFSLAPGTQLHGYCSNVLRLGFNQVFDPRKAKSVKAYLIFGVFYDVGLSSFISLYPNAELGQAIAFVILELMYLVLTLWLKPFKALLYNILFSVRRALFFVQGILIFSSALMKEGSSTISVLELIIFVASWIHILLSLVIIGVGFVAKPQAKAKSMTYKQSARNAEDSVKINDSEREHQNADIAIANRLARSDEADFEDEMGFGEGNIQKRGTSVLDDKKVLEVESRLGQ